jgi:hypothetical protein
MMLKEPQGGDPRRRIEPRRRPMRPARFTKTGLFALLFVGLAPVPSLWAGQARLVEEAGPDRVDQVVVETSDASADEVLAALAAHFGFAVERSAPSGQTVRFSGRLSGSLDQLLERLLRHEGHVIVRSAEARSGIARVVLMEAKGGTTPAPSVAGPIAALRARAAFMEGK